MDTEKEDLLKRLDRHEALQVEAIKAIHRASSSDTIYIDEAMRITGITKHAIYQRYYKGTIPAWKNPKTRRLHFSRKDLEAWLLEGKE